MLLLKELDWIIPSLSASAEKPSVRNEHKISERFYLPVRRRVKIKSPATACKKHIQLSVSVLTVKFILLDHHTCVLRDSKYFVFLKII